MAPGALPPVVWGSAALRSACRLHGTSGQPAPPRGHNRVRARPAAAHAPEGARLVKLADKIANLRDIDAAPPADWSFERRQEYFDWAKRVIDQVRGTHPRLEALFDASYALKPQVQS